MSGRREALRPRRLIPSSVCIICHIILSLVQQLLNNKLCVYLSLAVIAAMKRALKMKETGFVGMEFDARLKCYQLIVSFQPNKLKYCIFFLYFFYLFNFRNRQRRATSRQRRQRSLVETKSFERRFV